MRLFIAIELSQAIRDELARIQSHLKYSGADVKWVERGNIHLTLRFLGEVSEEKAEEIKSILDNIAKETKSFELSLKDIGAFPKIEYPRVVWVGLDEGRAESEKLAEKIDDELSKIGYEKESRPFAAHLTIGRVKSQENKDALKKSVSSCVVRDASCVIEKITLFQSTLTSKGPIYTRLHEIKLGSRIQ